MSQAGRISRATWILLSGTVAGSAVFLATSFAPVGGTTAAPDQAALVGNSGSHTNTGVSFVEHSTSTLSSTSTPEVSFEGAIHPDDVAKDVPLDEIEATDAAGTVIPRAARFAMPLQGWLSVTDRYGAARGNGLVHGGIDLALDHHVPVLASCAGTASANRNNTYGNYIIVDCGDGWSALYAHLSEILVLDGQYVAQRAVVGMSGSTGFSTGEHLHFEIWYRGGRVNPEHYLDFKIAPGTPLSSGPLIFYQEPGTGTGTGSGRESTATATTADSATSTETATPEPTVTNTPTNTPTVTPTPTATPTFTPTPTPKPPTPTRTPTPPLIFN